VKLPKSARLRPAIRTRWALALIVMLAFSCSSLTAHDPAVTSELSSSEAAQGTSNARKSVIPTHAGLELIVKADCANVRIFTDAQDSVIYAVRPNPRVAGADPDSLQDFHLTARNTSRGVMLMGETRRGRDCRGDVIYEIHVPRRYDLDIAVQSGNIVTQDIDGLVALSTGGGEIRAGRVGARDAAAKTPANAVFVARLETAGGDICVGNVAGGLRAATAGGQISTGDVHGPAVLRTGGGDIHVDHVFGAARFTSGGGNITAAKVDGGIWADTAGGRVEIGNLARLAAVATELPRGKHAFPSAVARRPDDLQGVPAIADLADVTELARLVDAFLWGGIRVDPADQQKRLVNSIVPEYPEVARMAGIEGDVTLRIFVGRDGTIRGITSVSGPPVLARAAMHSVEQWRYAPALLAGSPADVVTTVTLAFRLHP
jgi:TonB family protein